MLNTNRKLRGHQPPSCASHWRAQRRRWERGEGQLANCDNRALNICAGAKRKLPRTNFRIGLNRLDSVSTATSPSPSKLAFLSCCDWLPVFDCVAQATHLTGKTRNAEIRAGNMKDVHSRL